MNHWQPRAMGSAGFAFTFCDFDFNRASRAHGSAAGRVIPPEGWAIGRVGLIHARWDGHGLRVEADDLLEGGSVASDLVRMLDDGRLVIGHGILTADFRALAMVTAVPDSLLERTVDTLALVHRLRDGTFPAGCGLGDLARSNLGLHRSKPTMHQPAPWVKRGQPSPASTRGSHDPRDDAFLVAQLWLHLVESRGVSWAAAEPGWASNWGNASWSGSPAGEATLASEDLDALIGRRRQIESVEWKERVRTAGQVLLPTTRDQVAAALAARGARDLPAPGALAGSATGAILWEEIALSLQGAGELPGDERLSDEKRSAGFNGIKYESKRSCRTKPGKGRQPQCLSRGRCGGTAPSRVGAGSALSRRTGRGDKHRRCLLLQMTLVPDTAQLLHATSGAEMLTSREWDVPKP